MHHNLLRRRLSSLSHINLSLSLYMRVDSHLSRVCSSIVETASKPTTPRRHRYELLTSSSVIVSASLALGGTRVPSLNTTPLSPNPAAAGASTFRTPPRLIVRTPSSSAGHTGAISGLRSNVNAMGRLVFLVSTYTSPVSASAMTTLTPVKSPLFGVAPPPTLESEATSPSSGGPSENSSFVPSPSRRSSSTARRISPPSTDARSATNPSPPTMPKRRVSHRDAVAAGSYRLTPDPGSGFLSSVGSDPPGAEDSLNSTKDDASSSSPDDARKVRTGRRRRRRRRRTPLAGWGARIDARDETRVAARGATVADIGTTLMARARVTRGGPSSDSVASRFPSFFVVRPVSCRVILL